MLFHHLAKTFSELEHTSSGNAMRDILSSFLKKVTKEIDKVCYLTLGTISSPYDSVVLGMADQMVLKSIAAVSRKEPAIIKSDFKKYGDVGLVAEKKIKNKTPTLTVNDVFTQLHAIAQTTGSGSQGKKKSCYQPFSKDQHPWKRNISRALQWACSGWVQVIRFCSTA